MCTEGLPEGIDKDMSVILLVINVFAPGVGTLIAACLGTECMGSTVVIGIIQLLTWWLIVGWVWAIIWSVALYKKAVDKTPNLPTTQQQSPPPQAVSPPPPAATAPYGKVPNVPPAPHVPPPPQYVGAPPPPAPQ